MEQKDMEAHFGTIRIMDHPTPHTHTHTFSQFVHVAVTFEENYGQSHMKGNKRNCIYTE